LKSTKKTGCFFKLLFWPRLFPLFSFVLKKNRSWLEPAYFDRRFTLFVQLIWKVLLTKQGIHSKDEMILFSRQTLAYEFVSYSPARQGPGRFI
jgi:hypothetical protein